jgi:hypothetical protein
MQSESNRLELTFKLKAMMTEDERDSLDWELSELLPDEDIYIPAFSFYDGGDGIFGKRTLEKLLLSPMKESSAWSPPFDSPTAPYEEFGLAMDIDDLQNIPFLLEDTSDVLDEDRKMLPFDKRLEATAYSLAASMKRSQETRRFLAIKTPKTEEYSRRDSIKGVIESVQKSTEQLQSYLPKEEPTENDDAK